MTSLKRGDGDLHHADGTHRATPGSSASGRALVRHEERLRRHLAQHEQEESDDHDRTTERPG